MIVNRMGCSVIRLWWKTLNKLTELICATFKNRHWGSLKCTEKWFIILL